MCFWQFFFGLFSFFWVWPFWNSGQNSQLFDLAALERPQATILWAWHLEKCLQLKLHGAFQTGISTIKWQKGLTKNIFRRKNVVIKTIKKNTILIVIKPELPYDHFRIATYTYVLVPFLIILYKHKDTTDNDRLSMMDTIFYPVLYTGVNELFCGAILKWRHAKF